MARPARTDAHEALLAAARAEFSRRGLERARVEDVARRAGISKGAFYLHFRTKEEAFHELLQRFLGALEALAQRRATATARLAETPAGRGASAASTARWLELECAFDAELLELLWANRQLPRLLDGAGGHRWSKPVELFRGRLRALATGRVDQLRAAGLLRADLDAELAADLILGGSESRARRLAGLPARPDLVAWARSFTTSLYQGLLAPPAPPPRRRPPR